jgi:Domain of unknown function (DUF4148)
LAWPGAQTLRWAFPKFKSSLDRSVFQPEKDTDMTTLKTWAGLAWVLAGFCAGHAMAADPSEPKTREQVKAETREAIRTGDISAGGEVNCKLNELNPSRYPAKPATGPSKTREQVQAETREAMRSGQMGVNGEAGCGPQPVNPQGSGKTRAQVKAERDEAMRKGEMMGAGEAAGSVPAPRGAPKKNP